MVHIKRDYIFIVIFHHMLFPWNWSIPAPNIIKTIEIHILIHHCYQNQCTVFSFNQMVTAYLHPSFFSYLKVVYIKSLIIFSSDGNIIQTERISIIYLIILNDGVPYFKRWPSKKLHEPSRGYS